MLLFENLQTSGPFGAKPVAWWRETLETLRCRHIKLVPDENDSLFCFESAQVRVKAPPTYNPRFDNPLCHTGRRFGLPRPAKLPDLVWFGSVWFGSIWEGLSYWKHWPMETKVGWGKWLTGWLAEPDHRVKKLFAGEREGLEGGGRHLPHFFFKTHHSGQFSHTSPLRPTPSSGTFSILPFLSLLSS